MPSKLQPRRDAHTKKSTQTIEELLYDFPGDSYVKIFPREKNKQVAFSISHKQRDFELGVPRLSRTCQRGI